MYYVLSQGENPKRIFFDENVAKQEGSEFSNAYLDVFDADGMHVQAWHLADDGTGTGDLEWTTDF